MGELIPISNIENTLPKEVSVESVVVVGLPEHSVGGQVKTITDANDTYIRYENFKTIKGPDICVSFKRFWCKRIQIHNGLM